jgi:hypothetical protein
MDAETERAFVAHVKDIEASALAGDQHAIKSLACMALLAEGWRPSGPDGGGEVIEFRRFLKANFKAAA